MRCLHELYNKKVSFLGYLLTIQNACPTVKAFHRMNLNQNKCLNSKTASYMTGKVAKPKNQRTNGPVNAHLISWPSKAQNLEKYTVKK